jgi:hypothetical protein
MSPHVTIDKKATSPISNEPIQVNDNHCRVVEPESQEDSYNKVIPKETLTISVEYSFQGRKKPSPYPLDEE